MSAGSRRRGRGAAGAEAWLRQMGRGVGAAGSRPQHGAPRCPGPISFLEAASWPVLGPRPHRRPCLLSATGLKACDPQVWMASGSSATRPPAPQAHGHGEGPSDKGTRGAATSGLPGPVPGREAPLGEGILCALRRGRQGEDGILVRRTRGKARGVHSMGFVLTDLNCAGTPVRVPLDRGIPGTGATQTGASPGQGPPGQGPPRTGAPPGVRHRPSATAGLCPLLKATSNEDGHAGLT